LYSRGPHTQPTQVVRFPVSSKELHQILGNGHAAANNTSLTIIEDTRLAAGVNPVGQTMVYDGYSSFAIKVEVPGYISAGFFRKLGIPGTAHSLLANITITEITQRTKETTPARRA